MTENTPKTTKDVENRYFRGQSISGAKKDAEIAPGAVIPPQDASGDENPLKTVKIEPGSVWRDQEVTEWAEYVVFGVAIGKGSVNDNDQRPYNGGATLRDRPLVLYYALRNGRRSAELYARAVPSFLSRFRFVHGPTTAPAARPTEA